MGCCNDGKRVVLNWSCLLPYVKECFIWPMTLPFQEIWGQTKRWTVLHLHFTGLVNGPMCRNTARPAENANCIQDGGKEEDPYK